jgi:hypothetical protein
LFHNERVALTALTRDLLTWIAQKPRTYSDTMEAWRTSCPRLSIWEDAVGEGLVQIRSGNVTLTPRGEATLAAYAEAGNSASARLMKNVAPTER